jgi:psiF repeat
MTCPGKNAQSSVVHLRLPRLATLLCAMRLAVRYLAVVPAATAAAAQAPAPTCKAQADQKKLAGAALKSFMSKCEKDAATACSKSASDNKLSGAAKSSHVKKCVSDAVGS